MELRKTKRHEVETTDKWLEHDTNSIALSSGMGSNKSLYIRVRYDGYGNSIVRFIVEDHGKETEYEKYNAAVVAYNLLP